MLRGSTRRLIAFLCAAMLVWSQLAVAAYACPKDAVAASAEAMADMPPDCARDMNAKPSPLCQAHCDQPAQSNQTPSFALPPIVLASLAPVFDVFDLPPARVVFAPPAWLAGASPPLRIQFQVFRN